MRKKQKIKSKKQRQRSFRAFISIVNWYKNKFDVALYISNIQLLFLFAEKLVLWINDINVT